MFLKELLANFRQQTHNFAAEPIRVECADRIYGIPDFLGSEWGIDRFDRCLNFLAGFDQYLKRQLGDIMDALRMQGSFHLPESQLAFLRYLYQHGLKYTLFFDSVGWVSQLLSTHDRRSRQSWTMERPSSRLQSELHDLEALWMKYAKRVMKLWCNEWELAGCDPLYMYSLHLVVLTWRHITWDQQIRHHWIFIPIADPATEKWLACTVIFDFLTFPFGYTTHPDPAARKNEKFQINERSEGRQNSRDCKKLSFDYYRG